jgi:hypothetical protein
MNSHFKFPRRVRIHGGECGAVARALHHKAESLSLPAVKEKAFFTTNERKQMSTKTTLKRIALVAVSALGFSVLALVPAAKAIEINLSTIDAVAASDGLPLRVGDVSTINLTFTDVGQGIDYSADTLVIRAVFLTDGGVPSGSTNTSADLDVLTTVTRGSEAWSNQSTTAVTPISTLGQNVSVSGCTAALTACTTLTVRNAIAFTPSTAGTYKVLIWMDSDRDSTYDAGEVATTYTKATTTAPATLTLTKESIGNPTTTSTSNAEANFNVGGLWSITPKDAAGNVVNLTAEEALSLSSSISTTTFSKPSAVTTAVTALGASDQLSNGKIYFHARSTASATSTPTITVSGSGALDSGVSTTGTASFYVINNTDTTVAASAAPAGTAGIAETSGADAYTFSSAATSHGFKVSGTASTTATTYRTGVRTTDTNGDITGYYGAIFTTHLALSTDGDATFTIPVNIPRAKTVTMTVYDDDAGWVGTGTSTLASVSTAAASPSTIRAAAAGTVSFSVNVDDQFGLNVANASCSFSVSGRNVRTATTVLTDASGNAVFSYTDTGTASSVDTITVTNCGTITAPTVTWTATSDVSTVLLTTPNTTSTGVDEYPVDAEDINAGDGAESTLQAVTATVKDANGAVLAGVPVVFTISGTGAAILSTKVTVYTGSAGTAASSVYGWLAGTYTVTATAAGKSDTAPIIFAQETATEVRTISATVSGGSITVVAKDRFGNTIAGVPLKATRTSGEGSFAGSSSATGTTDANGANEFIISGGNAKVVVTFNDTNASTYGQSDALKGLTDGTTSTSTFAATTAGTTLVAETGVGASYDAAGVNSVTVDVTTTDKAAAAADAAADAAAEAIDAANAATDAANLAAEAADAATVAAEEARDAADAATAAVEELATQVATLMAALKAQITTLANTVAKIAKKVKA